MTGTDEDLSLTIEAQKEEIERKNGELETLKKALRLMASRKGSPVKSEDESEQFTLSTSEDSDSEADSDSDELPDPVFDGFCLFCSECIFELEIDPTAGICFCSKCGLEHDWETYKNELVPEGCFEDNQAMDVDRSLVPRGTTPVLDLDDFLQDEELPLELPFEYRPRACRKDEYLQLRRRGATQLMCEEFYLEFTYEDGIYAWADSDLFDEFAPSEMQEGDFWKIHLGRRIELEKDDLDGSKFIEGILEDALLFPLFPDTRKSHAGKWTTYEESAGIWVTRLKDGIEPFDDGASQLSDDEDIADNEAIAATDGAGENPPLGRVVLTNTYSITDDEEEQPLEEEEDELDEPPNESNAEVAREYPCGCRFENMCLVCMQDPEGTWSETFEDHDMEEVVDESDDTDSYYGESSARSTSVEPEAAHPL